MSVFHPKTVVDIPPFLSLLNLDGRQIQNLCDKWLASASAVLHRSAPLVFCFRVTFFWRACWWWQAAVVTMWLTELANSRLAFESAMAISSIKAEMADGHRSGTCGGRAQPALARPPLAPLRLHMPWLLVATRVGMRTEQLPMGGGSAAIPYPV